MPATKELGNKHVCFKCGTRFYDLKKPEPICPKCGADQRQSPVTKPATEKRVRAPARPVAPVEPAEAADAPEADADEDGEDDDDDEDEAEEDEP